ncbi:uncharacterized protein N7483_009888 [Penicillium malachiteum]|uniref:uncharacterized protein n=1 Tax=Penicillium malachiteum TaxID=1324776 RepID=UPI002547767E|nr:uncharacterized protein N7483_009888 [Penicillium malachiteum]KAJ5721954.1 hypothetical protein N7483_009888 [Penicillium malachiteum]
MSSLQARETYSVGSRGHAAEIGMYVVTALSTVVVLVRLYARGVLIRELGYDDYIIVIAQLIAWADMAFSIQTVRYGAGEHLTDLMENPEKMVSMYKWLVTAQMIYFTTLWICRVSGLAFYSRLNQMPQFQMWMRISFGFVTAVWITQSLIIGLQCIPLRFTLRPKHQGKLHEFYRRFHLNIRSYNLNMARKISLLFVFCFGVFSIVTSILRMVSMVDALHHASDITWYFSVVMAWSTAEISAIIVALSLPSLRGMFGFLRNKSRSTNKSTSRGTASIGLGSVPRVSKNRIYDGNSHQTSVDIDAVRSSSQEALWDMKDPQNIRIVDTVHMDIDELRPDQRD